MVEETKKRPSVQFMRMLDTLWRTTPRRARAQARGHYNTGLRSPMNNKKKQISEKI